MYKDNKVVTLKELLDLKRMGVNSINGFTLTDKNIKSITWYKNDISKLTNKTITRTDIGFTIDETADIPQLLLIVHNGYICELQWTIKTMTQVVKAWAGLQAVNLHIIHKQQIVETLWEDECPKELEYYIISDRLIVKTDLGFRIVLCSKGSNYTISKLNVKDTVNLMYELQRMKDTIVR